MANKTTTKKSPVSDATTTIESSVTVSVMDDSKERASENASEDKAVFIPKEIDPSQYVTVRNGFQGKLVYRSKRTGEMFIWDEFGDEQDMELGELKNARNSSKKFFINNWFMFDEPWIVKYLGMERYYKYAINIEEFDDLFTKSPDEVASVIANLSQGQKRSISYRARQLIADEVIDSKRMIKTLEKCLNTTLIED